MVDLGGEFHHEKGGVAHVNQTNRKLSNSFAVALLIATCATASLAGCLSRVFVLRRNGQMFIDLQQKLQGQSYSTAHNELKEITTKTLPSPKIKGNKEIPHATYTSRVLDTAASASARSLLLEYDRSTKHQLDPKLEKFKFDQLNRSDFSECYDSNQGEANETSLATHCKVSNKTASRYDTGVYGLDEFDSTDDEEDQVHLPAGQHLLVDIKNVDYEFLNDESRLAQAMIDVVWEADLTLLSYHCHTLFPVGVTCVGVLLESHISFHTWPEQGVITLDIFTCGSGGLLTIVSLIERLFAIPQAMCDEDSTGENELVESPVMIWSHKFRGFHDNWDKDPDSVPALAERKDLGAQVAYMDMDMKKEIVSVETPYQQIDIYDVIDPKNRDLRSYRLSQSEDRSTYESQHPEYFQPNRLVYLDGIVQSTSYGDAPYHEALVHPGMFAHANPKRAAIVGGGEGATLREILRHDTIEHVKMIEIDEMMVNVSRKYLKEWNDCSDIVGSAPNCFDDPRADIRLEDALGWFIDRFATRKRDSTSGRFSTGTEKEKFDVIIMDALDPQDNVSFAKFLYSNDDFTDALYNALTDEGVLIMQLGEAPWSTSVPDELGKSHMRASLEKDLIRFGFQSLHQYEEGACNFDGSWSFLVAFKSFSSRKFWYDSPVEVDLKIHHRTRKTVSGKPSLKSFDGSTMARYQMPHSAFETLFCHSITPVPECEYLRGYEPERPNAYSEDFQVQRTSLEKSSNGLGVGVFAKTFIPRGSMIMQEKSSNSIRFPSSTWDLLLSTYEVSRSAELKSVIDFVERFGFENGLLGEESYDVSSSTLSLVNHGCRGAWNVIPDEDWFLTEQDVNPHNMTNDARCTRYAKGPEAPLRQAFNPVIARHMTHIIGGYDVATRDIASGEEILANYLTSIGSAETWEETVTELQEFCNTTVEYEYA